MFDFIRLREHKIHHHDYLPASARLRSRKWAVAAWWGAGGGRTPSLRVGGVEQTDRFGKQLGVRYWSVGAPRPSSFSLGTFPGDLWGHVGMRAQGWPHPAGSWSPAPCHQQAMPLPWDPQRPEPSRQSCPGGADVSHQAALVFEGLGGAGCPHPKAPLRECSYWPPKSSRTSVSPAPVGQELGWARGVCRQKGSV